MDSVRGEAIVREPGRIESVLWVVGLLLFTVWAAARTYGQWSARRNITSFDAAAAVTASASAAAFAPLASFQPVNMSRWSDARKRHYHDALAVDPGPALAVLKVARIGLEVPVLAGTSELTLDRAAGHIEGTPEPGEDGNVGLAGHRDGFFRALEDIAEGDVVELRLPSKTLTYVVDKLRIVAPGDVSVLEPTTSPALTLVTCYPFHFVGSAPERFIVRAVRR